MVVDFDYFIESLGLPELDERLDVLIREVGTERYAQQTFYGDPQIQERDPAQLLFAFPFGTWELSATTEGGWPSSRPGYGKSLAVSLLLLALLMVAIWSVARLIVARRVAQQQLANAIEALPDAFVMFDPEGRLVKHNSKYRELQGGDATVIRRGTSYRQIAEYALERELYPDWVGREEEWISEWERLRASDGFDTLLLHRDGKMLLVSDRVMQDGSTVGLRIDVSELQEAKIAAEAADRAKSDFMAVLSHELRTPLTVMLGVARLSMHLERLPQAKALADAIETLPCESRDRLAGLQDGLVTKIKEMMKKLDQSGEHLLFLVNEILDFAKMEAGGLSLMREHVDAAELLRSVAEQIRPIAESKQLEVTLEAAPVSLPVDRKRIQQVMLNLLGNAVKFTQEGGIAVRSELSDGQYLVHVTDTGIGMPEEELSKIFQPFHQVDASNTRSIGGTGLGLAISREIAEAHGGTLVAQSREGEGSTFTLALPVSPEPEQGRITEIS
jgi:signal transduction histidine kinase